MSSVADQGVQQQQAQGLVGWGRGPAEAIAVVGRPAPCLNECPTCGLARPDLSSNAAQEEWLTDPMGVRSVTNCDDCIGYYELSPAAVAAIRRCW